MAGNTRIIRSFDFKYETSVAATERGSSSGASCESAGS